MSQTGCVSCRLFQSQRSKYTGEEKHLLRCFVRLPAAFDWTPEAVYIVAHLVWENYERMPPDQETAHLSFSLWHESVRYHPASTNERIGSPQLSGPPPNHLLARGRPALSHLIIPSARARLPCLAPAVRDPLPPPAGLGRCSSEIRGRRPTLEQRTLDKLPRRLKQALSHPRVVLCASTAPNSWEILFRDAVANTSCVGSWMDRHKQLMRKRNDVVEKVTCFWYN
jgi:hypothetical protein